RHRRAVHQRVCEGTTCCHGRRWCVASWSTWARVTVQEGVMALSKEERCRELARLVGIPLMEAEVAEVAEGFESLMRGLERLTQLDLAHIQPVLVFPEEEAQP